VMVTIINAENNHKSSKICVKSRGKSREDVKK
jgi:hypothetical protein